MGLQLSTEHRLEAIAPEGGSPSQAYAIESAPTGNTGVERIKSASHVPADCILNLALPERTDEPDTSAKNILFDCHLHRVARRSE